MALYLIRDGGKTALVRARNGDDAAALIGAGGASIERVQEIGDPAVIFESRARRLRPPTEPTESGDDATS